MKLIFERWNGFLKEIRTLTVPSRDEIVKYITENPNQVIHLDNPKGSKKAFGRGEENKIELPFDYGEYPDIINPADGMGWDIIIVPSGSQYDKELIPVGHIEYSRDRPEKLGNDKIIIAPRGHYVQNDVDTIEGFFNDLEGFERTRWY